MNTTDNAIVNYLIDLIHQDGSMAYITDDGDLEVVVDDYSLRLTFDQMEIWP